MAATRSSGQGDRNERRGKAHPPGGPPVPEPQRVLITGMSGTGKSSAVRALARRGFTGVDTDTDEWSVWVTDAQTGEPDWVWREDRLLDLLTRPRDRALFVSGCKSNQGALYPHFEHIVLLSAPPEVMLARVAARTDNPYGQRAEERALILEHLQVVEPLLRRRATLELNTAEQSVQQVADRLAALVSR